MRAKTPDLGSLEKRACVLCGNAFATLSQRDVTKMARRRQNRRDQPTDGRWRGVLCTCPAAGCEERWCKNLSSRNLLICCWGGEVVY